MNNSKFILLTILLSLLNILGCKCNQIKLPGADRTPPSCSWEVQILDDDTKQELANGGVLNLGTRYKIRVYFKVKDNDGGVRRIKVSGIGTKAYPQINTYVDWGPQNQLSWNEDNTSAPDAQNMVSQSSTLMGVFDLTPLPPNGSGGRLQLQVITPAGGSLNLEGRGENYHEGICTSRLTITATPKSP